MRVVHVGDAPSDILAAKYCADNGIFGDSIEVGVIGVATGKFQVDELSALIGQPIPGQWDPVVLKDGLNDPAFLSHCKIITTCSD